MRLLDLYCGAGGAAYGYHQAGFTEIIGIDLMPQPRYPYMMIQADLSRPTLPVDPDSFDLIHASPPCQASTTMGNRWANPRWPDLIPHTRRLLLESGRPYVIENVIGADLDDPLKLTGEQFGLDTTRPRRFEINGFFIMSPPPARRKDGAVSVYGKPDGRHLWTRHDGSQLRAWSSIQEGKDAIGVPWMTDELEIREAIPPAYTQYIGEAFLQQQTHVR